MKYIGTTTRDMLPYIDLAVLTPDKLQFRTARYELVDGLIKAGHYACVVYATDYQGGCKFSRHLYPVDAKQLRYELRGEITLDALYDKSKLYPVDLPHITDREVGQICNDKSRTYSIVGDLQPKSLVITDPGELSQLATLDNGSGMVVVKSFEGFGGDEVRIGLIKDIQAAADLPVFPLLAQEFIETSGGVPGLVDGRHDVRVLVLNGEVLGGSVRTPQKGGLLSNTHQGGSMRMLSINELPKQLQEFALQVDARLPQRPRLYAADFMYSLPLKKWFLVELNGSPGALPSSFLPVGPIFQEKLRAALIAIAN